MYFENLVKDFSALPEIRAIALGGSRAGGSFDEKSDYDLYLYCDRVPDEKTRRSILERHCTYMEISNRFWELEDDCTFKDGVDIDILYRSLEDFERGLIDVVEQCHTYNAYTTCMWHNLLHSKILYDRDGALSALKERFDVPYPEALRQNIIENHLKLLSGHLPSYDRQIIKASERGDLVSVNHRAAAFLETYFDLIFAVNRLTHPGEKRMIEYAVRNCAILPDQLEENVTSLLHDLSASPDRVRDDLTLILHDLQAIL